MEQRRTDDDSGAYNVGKFMVLTVGAAAKKQVGRRWERSKVT